MKKCAPLATVLLLYATGTTVGTTGALRLRRRSARESNEEGAGRRRDDGALPPPPERRKLCKSTAAPSWHPNYAAGWTAGHCIYTVDCDSPAYPTELACCKAAYAGQVSGACLASLPSPPTASPTETGEPSFVMSFDPDFQSFCFSPPLLPPPHRHSSRCTPGGIDVYYPDYSMTWTEGHCINSRPMPSGRPTYATMLECCKAAYAGQVSGESECFVGSSIVAQFVLGEAFWGGIE